MSCRPVALALVAWLGGCAGVVTGGGEPAEGDADEADDDDEVPLPAPVGREPGAPILTIDAPPRGAIVEGDTVFVSGRVLADTSAVATLTVNGRPTGIAEDGSFTVAVTVPSGITTIETAATSVDGPRASDIRAVLAGTLAPPDTRVEAGVTAHIGPRAFSRLASMVAAEARAINLTAAATAMNPLVDTGGSCNSARISVSSVSRSDIAVGAAPVSGGIDVGAQVRGLVVQGRLSFRVLCISGSTSWTIRASVYGARGVFHPYLSGGGFRVGLSGVQSGFASFGLSIGGVPGFITDLFAGAVRSRLNGMLRDRIASVVPRQVNTLLRDFVADDLDVSILGRSVRTSILPTSMVWSNVGGTIGLRTSAVVEGGDAPYLSTPRAAPSSEVMVSNDLRVSVADDAVDQLLGGLWASGAFEVSANESLAEELEAMGVTTDLAGGSVRLSLPPVAAFDAGTGSARVVLGDVIIEATSPAGTTTLAASATIDLVAAAGVDGRIRLRALPPQVVYQILGDRAAEALDAELAGQIAAIVSEHLAGDFGDALGALAIPGLPGAALSDVGVAPVGGHLVAGGTLSFH